AHQVQGGHLQRGANRASTGYGPIDDADDALEIERRQADDPRREIPLDDRSSSFGRLAVHPQKRHALAQSHKSAVGVSEDEHEIETGDRPETGANPLRGLKWPRRDGDRLRLEMRDAHVLIPRCHGRLERCAAISSSILRTMTRGGSSPLSNKAAWNALMSNRSPNCALARSRNDMISRKPH